MAMGSVRAIGLVELVEGVIAVDTSPWTLIFADILAPAVLDHDEAVKAEAQTVIAGPDRAYAAGERGANAAGRWRHTLAGPGRCADLSALYAGRGARSFSSEAIRERRRCRRTWTPSQNPLPRSLLSMR